MESTFLVQQFVPLMFAGLFLLLLTGFPVAFGLAATGLAFGFIGMEAGLFPANLFQALPSRIFGIMQNPPSRKVRQAPAKIGGQKRHWLLYKYGLQGAAAAPWLV